MCAWFRVLECRLRPTAFQIESLGLGLWGGVHRVKGGRVMFLLLLLLSLGPTPCT